MGDRLAFLAAHLRMLGSMGFPWMVAGWTAIACLVVLPGALVAGYQFPLLIALLGRGRPGVGREVGLTYAANTAGSIVGSMAGGFGLVPLLGAVDAWRFVAITLAALSLVTFVLSNLRERAPRLRLALTAFVLLATVGSLAARGPTAAWRHSGVGAGRSQFEQKKSRQAVIGAIHSWNSSIVSERDGVESSVGMYGADGLAFIVNGRFDGSAFVDTGTQVMGGLIGAALHQNPTRALVIGLGTGSTAGWLGKVPSIERVDVAEIEPAVLQVAKSMAVVNNDVLANPKVVVHLEDAREMLLTSRDRYDVVFSEPSNPYRAGIASLYTQEFYQAVKQRLSDDGVFLQWLQAYDIEPETMRRVLVTLASAFPNVEVWSTQSGDLILVARPREFPVDVAALRARLTQPPFAQALRLAWNTDTAEGFLAHHLASRKLADTLVAGSPDEVNVDDVNVVEFGFAKSVGTAAQSGWFELLQVARRLGAERPATANGELDWSLWQEESMGFLREDRADAPPDVRRRVELLLKGQPPPPGVPALTPRTLIERLTAAQALAETRDERAVELAAGLEPALPAEAAAIRGQLRLRQGRVADGVAELAAAVGEVRRGTWFSQVLSLRAVLAEAVQRLRGDPASGRTLFDALDGPLPAMNMEQNRKLLRKDLAVLVDARGLCAGAYQAFEPWVPWTGDFLAGRAECYRATGSPLEAQARADLERFQANEPEGLVPSDLLQGGGERASEAPPASSSAGR